LKETAKIIVRDHKGKVPNDPLVLETFPGIGHYTARALAAFAFKHREAFIDTNIRRVYLHFFFPKKTKVRDSDILAVAQKTLGKQDPREWHYALFDYGALALKDPRINKRSASYRKQSVFIGSARQFRAMALGHVLAHRSKGIAKRELLSFLRKNMRRESSFSPRSVLQSLIV
jgi:A/G-specific adenine glycosylase